MFQISQQQTHQRHAVYFGILIIVPHTIQYLATNKAGNIIGFVEEPIQTFDNWTSTSQSIPIIDCIFEGDWTQSLLQIPDR